VIKVYYKYCLSGPNGTGDDFLLIAKESDSKIIHISGWHIDSYRLAHNYTTDKDGVN
jgi:hypothetical protein